MLNTCCSCTACMTVPLGRVLIASCVTPEPAPALPPVGFAALLLCRSSRLTHLLQDSLGGNCNTTLIVTVAPCVDAFEDSMAALKFADRTRNVANKAVVNSTHDTDTILALKVGCCTWQPCISWTDWMAACLMQPLPGLEIALCYRHCTHIAAPQLVQRHPTL